MGQSEAAQAQPAAPGSFKASVPLAPVTSAVVEPQGSSPHSGNSGDSRLSCVKATVPKWPLPASPCPAVLLLPGSQASQLLLQGPSCDPCLVKPPPHPGGLSQGHFIPKGHPGHGQSTGRGEGGVRGGLRPGLASLSSAGASASHSGQVASMEQGSRANRVPAGPSAGRGAQQRLPRHFLPLRHVW